MNQREKMLPDLYQRKEELETVIRQASKYTEFPVKGFLEVNWNQNHYRYYLKEKSSTAESKEKTKRKYIKDVKLAKNMASHDYAKRIIKSATMELKHITSLIATYQKPTVEEIFKSMHPGRQILVEPLVLDDEQYAEQWLSNSPKYQNPYPIQFAIQTENHEMVRSKSEKIIADKLKMAGVPYIYEKPLQIGKKYKYPDFTVLNKRTRQEYYWEHMGLIDQPDYFKTAMNKIETYSQNQIWLGKNLIITYETTDTSLNVEWIEQIIEEYLL